MYLPSQELQAVSLWTTCAGEQFNRLTDPVRKFLANEDSWLRQATLQRGGNHEDRCRYWQHDGKKSAVTANIRISSGEAVHERDTCYLGGIKTYNVKYVTCVVCLHITGSVNGFPF